MIQLYSRTETAGTIVHCVLEWSGAPYELIAVRRANGAISPEGYPELNPSGVVPTLVDGELVLYETVAILEHLVETLTGIGPRAGEPGRAQLHFWLAWLTNNLMAAFYRYFKADQMIEAMSVPALEAGAKRDLERQGRWLEQQVAERDWLLPGSPTVADIFLQGLDSWAEYIDGLTFGGEALARHAARTVALPGVASALDRDRELAA